jgi:hypothetical protein
MFTLTRGVQQLVSLSASKSNSILFSIRRRLRNFPPYTHVDFAGCNIPVTDSLLPLGITLDSTLSFGSHVSQLSKQSFFRLPALRHVRHCRTTDMANAAALAVVQSRLGYANSLLYSTSSCNIHKLQCVPDTLSCHVINQSNISFCERHYYLHRLPIHLPINFKLALPTYKTITLHQPSYLSSLLSPHSISQSLHSFNQSLLHQPRVRSVTGPRAFSSSVPNTHGILNLHLYVPRLPSTLPLFQVSA